MSIYFEAMSEPINKVYINDVELDATNKKINIDRAYFVGWEEVDTSTSKPSIYDSGVLYHNEIHFIGTSKSDTTKGMHCKFDGVNWTKDVSTLPYNPAYCKALVYNDEIHIFGGNINSTTKSKDYKSQKYHYKLNKDTNVWEKVSSLPYYFFGGSAVVYNGNMHILGGGRTSTTRKKHYYFKAKTKTWKSSTALNQLLRGFYKAFVVTNSQGVDTLYFCGEKTLGWQSGNYSKLYYYNRSKKKWQVALNFKTLAGSSTDTVNCGYADMFESFGGEVYVYGSNESVKTMDNVRGLMFDSSGLFKSSYPFSNNVFARRIGKYSHMFFVNGELWLFQEDGEVAKSNAIVYTVEVTK